MKKTEIIQVGKSQYELNSKTINQVLEFVLKMDKKDVFLVDEIDIGDFLNVENVFKKISLGYPLAYITHKVNFMGLDFYIDEGVLIPRDDTEVLVKHVVESLKKKNDRSKEVLIDIGTGSGIIPISIVKKTELDFEKIIALELSKDAIKVAEKNIKLYNLEDKINLLNTDFRQFDFEQFEGKDLIVTANLPYIKDADFKNMDFGVYTFEPKMALYGGIETGFELYEELINLFINLKSRFKSISLFIEIGFDQYDVSKKSLERKGLKFEYFKDTNNIYRVIKINF